MSESVNILEQLSAYLDGELDASDARAVEAAVAADVEVARELDRLRAARELVRHLPREQAPGDFALRVMAQAERGALLVHAAPVGPRPGRRWLRNVAMAASVLVALSAGLAVCVSVYKGLRPDHPSRRVATNHSASPPEVVVHYGKQPYAAKGDSAVSSERLAMHDRDESTESLRGVASPVANVGGSMGGGHSLARPESSGRRDHSTAGQGSTESNASSDWPEEFEELAKAYPLQGWQDWLGESTEASADAPAESDLLEETEGVAADKLAAATVKDEAPARRGVAVLDPLGDALAMLISTDDVERTQRRVEDIFTSNGAALLSVQPL
jgi:hypothetical protein